MARKRICIVSTSSLSSGPRVVKEADALSSAGHEVHVLVCHTLPWMTAWDAELARDKPWSYEALSWQAAERRQLLGLSTRGIQALCRATAGITGAHTPLLALALSDRMLPLFVRGLRRRADLFVAHNIGALPVAAELARVHRALLAFDAEDYHTGELPDVASDRAEVRVIDAVQARYLPRCALVSAASDGAADALAARYRVDRPTVVHNVFPFALRDGIDGLRRDRKNGALSFYWYSQSLGLDRGLQDLLCACFKLRGDFEVHLRGYAPDDVRAELLRRAAAGGFENRIFFHPQVHPTELLSRTAEHDVGFALEQPVSVNRLQTVTNKLFYYMVAGLALVATDTPGQRRIMQEVPGTGFLYPPEDCAALAKGLQRWLDDPQALADARAASLEAARTTWKWELEQEKLVASYERAFTRRRAAPARAAHSGAR